MTNQNNAYSLSQNSGFNFVALVNLWSDRAAQRKELQNIPAHLLSDIGINEADRTKEAQKRFWKA